MEIFYKRKGNNKLTNKVIMVTYFNNVLSKLRSEQYFEYNDLS